MKKKTKIETNGCENEVLSGQVSKDGRFQNSASHRLGICRSGQPFPKEPCCFSKPWEHLRAPLQSTANLKHEKKNGKEQQQPRQETSLKSRPSVTGMARILEGNIEFRAVKVPRQNGAYCGSIPLLNKLLS